MSLTAEIEPQAESLLDRLGELVDGLASPEEGPVESALDAILASLGADRGTLLLIEGGSEVIVSARNAAGALPPEEWEEISRTVVRQALESGEPVLWDGFGDPADAASLTEIGILAAIALPVGAPGEEVRGVLYVDVRTVGKSIGPAHERFLRVAASLLAHTVRAERAVEAAAPKPAESSSGLPLFELLASPAMTEAAEAAEAALESQLNVLVRGPSGSGKTELALALARATGRTPVVRATLGSSDDLNTITSELFGHERGAFSGAVGRRTGLVQHADGGTLILDEVLNLPPRAQQLLLDFTQFGTFRPLGYDAANPRSADVRIIAATQGDLEAAIDEGRFRRDLFYRLAGVEIRMPALSERREDLPALAEALLRRMDPSRPWRLALGIRRALVRGDHPWPGNLRELEALMSRARHRALQRESKTDVIVPNDLGDALGPTPQGPPPKSDVPPRPTATIEERWAALEAEKERLARLEGEVLADALSEERGVVSRTARRLGLPRTTLVHRIQVLGVESRE